MRAIILAAGRGSRMGAHTDDRPKCLVEFEGRPLLDWQLQALGQAGIDEVGIVTGYRSDLLESRADMAFHNPRWEHTQMVSSLEAADAWLRDAPCVVAYSDIVYTADQVALLTDSRAALAITYDPDWLDKWSARFDDPLDDAETFRLNGDRVTEIGARPTDIGQIEGQFMGLLRFTPEAWAALRALRDQMPAEGRAQQQMTHALQTMIEHGTTVVGLPTQQRWFEFDSADDLAAAGEGS